MRRFAALLVAALGVGCSQSPGPQWRIAVENLGSKAAEVSVDYSVEGGSTPGKHTIAEETNPKNHVALIEGDGKVTVHAITFLVAKTKRSSDRETSARPGQTITITLAADESVSLRVE